MNVYTKKIKFFYKSKLSILNQSAYVCKKKSCSFELIIF